VNAGYPLHEKASGLVAAPAQALFDHLDDPHRLSAHMERPSMAMLGTSMRVITDAQDGRAAGSVIRMDGRVLGIPLSLGEVVTERDPPTLKVWETLGEPRLLVIGAYRMGFRIAEADGDALLTIFIDYALPGGKLRFAGKLLGRTYARWCCRRMLVDAQDAFASGSGAPPRRQPLA
jgi:hypothetical protein